MVSLSSFFLNPAGLATALILIPFLILYLIRPKPRRETVPSLLFVMKDMGKSNIDSFFRTLFKDLLLLIQLFLLLALIAAAAKPYINVPKSYLVEQTVIVLDASASMQANDGARFDEAVTKAKEVLGQENTIILAKGSPDIVAERVSRGEAEDLLDGLEASDTSTDLSGAIQLSSGYAGSGSRVVVISDFIPTTGDLDYDTAADAVESLGALVEYVPIESHARNVGIIDLAVGATASTVWIKNYNDRPEEVTLRISDAEQQVVLAKGETKELEFKTPAGVAEIEIRQDDDLLADNKAWTSTPEKNNVKVLIITNDRATVERSNLLLALSVIEKNFPTTFDIEYAVPPQMPGLDHDVYIVNGANMNLILPRYVKEIKEDIEQGAAAVVFAQSDVFALDWQGLLPVQGASETQGGRATITAPEVTTLTQDIDFGQTGSYIRVVAAEGASTVASAEEDPIIVLQRLGKGHVLYYGLDDTKASFSKDPGYPVFWRRSFDMLTNRPSLENLNLRTGSILALPRAESIKTPDGRLTAAMLPLDQAGLYTLSDRTVVANLLSDGESRLATQGVNNTQRASTSAEAERAPKDLSGIILWAAIALLVLELLYVKYRGDF